MTNRRSNSLQNAILATFSSLSNDDIARNLQNFDLRDWKRLGTWIHASGLALYFLEEVRSRSLHCLLPATVLEGLQRNRIDNSLRTESLLAEFMHLNAEFNDAHLDYLNVKGFSLGSEYYASPSLRSQFDLDFWVREDQVLHCEALMHRLGYQTIASTATTLEFRAGEKAYPSFSEFYKSRRERAVEVHLKPVQQMRDLSRGIGWIGEYAFPTLSREQVFLEQALHLTKHLRHEWARASWMLELRHAINHHYDDSLFWRGVREACVSPESRLALGIAIEATTTVFPMNVPEHLISLYVHTMPVNAVRWIRQYAKTVSTSQFPGSKLYLILERELLHDVDEYRQKRRSALLPLRIPGSIATNAANTLCWESLPSQAKYLGMRFAFHIREGLRLVREESRWNQSAPLSPRALEHEHVGSVYGPIQ